MKKDKFCFSRTLVYLVMLLVLGAGLLWGINYLNQQNNLASKPKADERKCYITRTDSSCENFFKRLYPSGNPKYQVITPEPTFSGPGIKCCFKPAFVNGYACKTLKNKIKKRDAKNCVVYTGNLRKLPTGFFYKGDESDCEVRYDNGNACGNAPTGATVNPKPTITYINEYRKAKVDMKSYCDSLKKKVVGCASANKKIVLSDGSEKYRCVGVKYFTGDQILSTKYNIEGPKGCVITTDQYYSIDWDHQINSANSAYNSNDANFDFTTYTITYTPPTKCSERACVNGYAVGKEFMMGGVKFVCKCNDDESSNEKPKIVQLP